MDTVLLVFEKLNIDQTIFAQFAVLIVIYPLLKSVLFNKLQFVLELRESKTTKMEENANKKFQQAEQLSEKYRVELDKAYSEAQETYHQKKNEIVEREKKKVRQVEEELNLDFEKRKAEYAEDLEEKRNKVLESADELSNDLVQRIVQ